MYSPHIDESQVKKLWKLKTLNEVLTGERKPMTEMVKDAIEEYLGKKSARINRLLRDKDMATLSLKVLEYGAKEENEGNKKKE